jgi:hypothetical protein
VEITIKVQVLIPKIIFILASFFSCVKNEYNPRLVEYLRAEQDLRKRVSEEQGLEDSIKVLQRKYNVNLERELSKLNDNPEAWLELIKELKGEK